MNSAWCELTSQPRPSPARSVPIRAFLSSSLLNAERAGAHGLYRAAPALVLSPRSRLLCSYPQDSGTKSWSEAKAVKLDGKAMQGCGPILCASTWAETYPTVPEWILPPEGQEGEPPARDAPFPAPTHERGYPCAFPASMFSQMLSVFTAASSEQSAYTEVVISTDDSAFAFDAVVGDDEGARAAHANLLSHFGLNANQLPRLSFGPGLKGAGPLFA